ncbi:YchF/TatD family DNA exonuclease [Myxococcota bacterium]|nr:YchF/TatD family DNA exonuclease [Myxococcota bacterium]
MTPAGWFDSHAHLSREFFPEDLPEVISRAFEAGLDGILDIGSSARPEAWQEAIEVASSHPRIWAALGVHPHEADQATERTFEDLERALAHPRVVALGEVGLDFHYDLSRRDTQVRVFDRQIEIAARLGKPLILHVREAHREAWEVLRGRTLPWPPGVVHCFTEGPEVARTWREMGFLISIPGIVTFPKAGPLVEAVRGLRAEDLLVETDAPYLAPVPHRGRRNEPAFVCHTGEFVASLKGLTPQDLARVTRVSARRLFGLPADGDLEPRVVYPIRSSLYVNLTNRCTLHCTFCSKFRDWVVKGHNLRLRGEPSPEVLWNALEEAGFRGYREVVFCGYGEPLLRWEVVRDLGRRVRAAGIPVRVNTDGLASRVFGLDVPEALEGAVDEYSVSLNAPDPATYATICRSSLGEEAHRAVCDFIRSARRHASRVTATVVALPGIDIEAARRLAEEDLGVGFRVRPLDDPG